MFRKFLLCLLLCQQASAAEWYPSGAEIVSVVESAASGDVIHLPPGQWPLGETLTVPGGVWLIGDIEGTTLSGTVNSLGGPDPVVFLNFSIELQDAGVSLSDGTYFLSRIKIQGPAAEVANNLTFLAASEATTACLYAVESVGASRDCISFVASTDALGALSKAFLWMCVASSPGPAQIDNCLTTHKSWSIRDFHGKYDSDGLTVNPDGPDARIELWGTQVTGYTKCWRATDSTFTQSGQDLPAVELVGESAMMLRCRVSGDAQTTAGVTCYCGNPRVESSLVSGVRSGSAVLGSSLSTGVFTVLNTVSVDCKHGFYFGNTSSVDKIFLVNSRERSTVPGAWSVVILGEPVTVGMVNSLQNPTWGYHPVSGEVPPARFDFWPYQ